VIIIGAGLAGLMAGALERSAPVYEAQKEVPNNHHAVLRFREDQIGRALNIPFRKVRVMKGVVNSRGPISDANAYSHKVLKIYATRSIVDLAPVDRYIAPPDFIQQLADMIGRRLSLGYSITPEELKHMKGKPILSTIPMPAMLKLLNIDHDATEFRKRSVRVFKYSVKDCDLFQTLYLPYNNIFYRATLTGSELMLETAESDAVRDFDDSLAEVLDGFNLKLRDIEMMGVHHQSLGKIDPLPARRRKALLLALTVEHGVFSLGRYACWRNLLLDDVYNDYFKVKRLIDLDSTYDFRRAIK